MENIDLSFEKAQKLYNLYTTSKTNISLRNNLTELLGDKIIENSPNQRTREIYNNIILKYYPNETTIKSSFIKHSLFKKKNHVTIFELNVGTSRVDLCKINSISTAFEIKTDLDNLKRLPKQLKDYLEIFEKVIVICSKSKLPLVEEVILPSCGIYSYFMNQNGIYQFKIERRATTSNSLNPHKQLSIIPKKDLVSLFNLSSSLSKEEMICRIFEKKSNNIINNKFKQYLKDKYQQNWTFIQENHNEILEIDYQWFFKNTVNPEIIYNP